MMPASIIISNLPCRCEFWVWCDFKKGCDDAGDFSTGVYPYHGCQLMQLPRDVEPQNWDRGPMFSSIQSGYITGEDPPWPKSRMCLSE